jgi:uncharacterized protein (TIGR03067 family)
MRWTVCLIAAAVGLALLLHADAQEEKKGKDKGLDALKGTWTAKTLERGGQAVPDDDLKELQMQLIFDGDKYTERIRGKVNEEGTIKIDTSKKPHTIDLMIRTGNDAGKLQVCIYEIKGDTLKMCLALPGDKERPTEFTSPDGQTRANVVFQRAKAKE